MRWTILTVLVLVAAWGPEVQGICNSVPLPPPPEEPEPDPVDGPPSTPDSDDPPPAPAPDEPEADPPSTPEDDAPEAPETPAPEDDEPARPAPAPPSTEDPPAPDAPAQGPDPRAPITGRPQVEGRRAHATSGAAVGWRIWWEFNRERIIGTRHTLFYSATYTGSEGPRTPNPLRARRDEVMHTLRRLAGDRRGDRQLRWSALLALGRCGGAQEAELFVRILRDDSEPAMVRETAAFALGLLRSIDDEEVAALVRQQINLSLENPKALPAKTRDLLAIGAGLRARTDKALVARLAQQVVAGPQSSDEGAALAFGCGLSEDAMLLPELLHAARRGQIGDVRLSDVGRGHAALGLGRMGDPAAIPTLLQILRSRSAGVHTRRGAVVALGRLLRVCTVDPDERKKAELALHKLLTGKGDVIERGYAALALGEAGDVAASMDALMRIVDANPRAELKPFAAMALALAARRATEAHATRIQGFLLKELRHCHAHDLEAALCVAVGLSGAREALPDLLERVKNGRLPAEVRGAAANGAGMVGRGSAQAEKVLIDALKEGPSDLVGEAALGVGLVGGRTAVGVLLDMIPGAKSSLSQGRLLVALGHLGHPDSVGPLLEIVSNEHNNIFLREHAAEALGLMGDDREVDALFDVCSDFNYYASTRATYEMLRKRM